MQGNIYFQEFLISEIMSDIVAATSLESTLDLQASKSVGKTQNKPPPARVAPKASPAKVLYNSSLPQYEIPTDITAEETIPTNYTDTQKVKSTDQVKLGIYENKGPKVPIVENKPAGDFLNARSIDVTPNGGQNPKKNNTGLELNSGEDFQDRDSAYNWEISNRNPSMSKEATMKNKEESLQGNEEANQSSLEQSNGDDEALVE